MFFGPPYHVADHAALSPRGSIKGIRWVLIVSGAVWLSLVLVDGVCRFWERKPKSVWVFKGANVLNQPPNLRHQPWPFEGNLARKLAVPQLAQPYVAREDVTPQWITTDEYGYRLGTSAPPYEVVLCGDSFFDNGTIADSLAHFSGRRVGNMAIDGRGPLSMTRFLAAAPPAYQPAKVVVWGKIESAITLSEFESMKGQRDELQPSSRLKHLKHSWEQSLFWPTSADLYLTESSALKQLLKRIVSQLDWLLTTSHTPEILLGRQDLPAGQAPMLFKADDAGLQPPPSTKDLMLIADKIASVNKELASRGVLLYFTVAPDKSTVYRERLPRDRSFTGTFESELVRLLHTRGVRTITLSEGIRKAGLANPTNELYYTTDTHWNAQGQTLAARIIADSLRKSSQFLAVE